MKILIAYDNSRCSDEALEDLNQAGLPSDTEALVVSMADVLLPPSEGEVNPNLPKRVSTLVQKSRLEAKRAVEEARALAGRACQRLQTNFPEWKITTEAYGDSPAWGVIKRADSWKPDLIVVGSHRYFLLKRLLVGSVSQKVLKEARCSVRIGRVCKQRRESSLRLVVGIDGFSDAEVAVDEISKRRWSPDTAVYLVSVAGTKIPAATTPPPSAPRPPWIRKIGNDPHTGSLGAIEVAKEKCRVKGLSVSCVIKRGDPKNVLVNEAERFEADCIFLGARGAGTARHGVGHTASAIARSAHCSVEIVRSVRGL